MAWLRFAPLFAVLALAAGAVGATVPQAKTAALAALTLFGAASLYGWLLSYQAVESARNDLQAAETENARLTREVNRHRDALDDLAEGLEILVFLLDTNLKVLYANRRATEAFRFPEPRGQSLLGVTLANDLVEQIQNLRDNDQAVSAELVLRHPEERTYQVHAWPESSGRDRIFLSLYDITDLRYLERVRRDFVANVSHELRTPMTTIRAMAETLEDGEDDRELAKRYLAKIIREVDRLTRITDDLLTLSVADAGATNKTPTDIAEIVRSVVQQLTPKAIEKNLSLGYVGPTKLPILANETQIAQIAFNLVDNAINYTATGKIDVRLAAQSERVELTVSDTGIGISSDHLPRVFERFYRVDKGRSRATGGTGLGLSIVRHLAEAHGGKVAVESELNKGSTFTVHLPKT